MRKIISVLIISAVMLVICPLSSAAADGGEITAVVTVGPYESIISGAIELIYDSEALEIVDGAVLIPGAMGDFDKANGLSVFLAMTPFSVSGDIFSVTFRVKDGAPAGASQDVTASVTLTNADGEDVKLSVPLSAGAASCRHTNKTADSGKDATCKESGYTAGEYCHDCGEWISGHMEIPQLTEHNYGECTKISDTQHKHICTVCGAEETADHEWDEGTVVTEPTQNAEGQKKYTCTECGATRTEAIAKLPADPITEPTTDPIAEPTTDPTANPTADPTTEPTIDPIADPTADPTTEPTFEPIINPTTDPITDPTTDPIINPTADPTSEPITDPTADPTTEPTTDPIADPTTDPTADPTTPVDPDDQAPKDGSKLWLIMVGVVAAAAAATGIGAAAVTKKKKQ